MYDYKAKDKFIYGEEIEYYEFNKLDEKYTYIVYIETEKNEVEIKFTVELLEGTDYKISFDMN